MQKVNFDEYAEKYDNILAKQLEFFDSDNTYFSEYKVLALKKLLLSEPKTILDFGCGIGRSTFFLSQHFPHSHVYGFDVSEQSLIKARESVFGATFLSHYELLQSAMTFDVVFIACVFHHIQPLNRVSVMRSIIEMCVKNSIIVIFEHNPYNPLTRYLVSRCPFDHDAVLLKPSELKKLFSQAGIKDIQYHYTLFFPSQLRWLRFLERYLRFIPVGGQYVISGQL